MSSSSSSRETRSDPLPSSSSRGRKRETSPRKQSKLNQEVVINFFALDDLGPLPRERQRPTSTRHRIAQASSGTSNHQYQSLDSDSPPVHVSRFATRVLSPSSSRRSSSDSNSADRGRIREVDRLHPDSANDMSRPTSSHRPTQIPMPVNESGSPTGSPRPPASPTSPRSSFLPSFMRTRSRTVTQPHRSHTGAGDATTSRDPSSGPHASGGAPTSTVTRSVSTPVTGGLNTNTTSTAHNLAGSTNASSTTNANMPPLPTEPAESKTHRIRLVPHLESTRSLAFDPVVREVLPMIVPPGVTPSACAASISHVEPTLNGKPPALLLKIGRFTDKSQLPVPNSAAAAVGGSGGNMGTGSANAVASGSGGGAASAGGGAGSAPVTASLTIAGGGGDICSPKVAFKSKVVSRSHAEIWCEPGGKFFIRDTASSSGTFLNHIRLSSPNVDSRPTALNDGDVLQLGVDYQGGIEDMFRCVKMRVELGREWQRAANEFNTNALKQLKALGGDLKGKAAESSPISSSKRKASVTDCCICLFSVTVCQSLFIAPCSHVFHYKCIRPLLQQHYPGFSCPLCRTFANLEEDVETEDAWEIASRRASVISRRPSGHSIRLPVPADNPVAPGSDGVEGEPSTGIGFGQRTASVEELLAADSQSSGSELGMDHSGDTSNAVEMRGGIQLDRQTTAVPASRAARADATGSTESTIALGPPAGEPIGISPSQSQDMEHDQAQGGGMSIPGTSDQSNPTPTTLDSQTPQNDTFLATLAPGMHQRLDLAQQMNLLGRDEALPEIAEDEPLISGDSAPTPGSQVPDADQVSSIISRNNNPFSAIAKSADVSGDPTPLGTSGSVGDHAQASGVNVDDAGSGSGSGSGSGVNGDGEATDRGDEGWVQFDADDVPSAGGLGGRTGKERKQDVEMMFS